MGSLEGPFRTSSSYSIHGRRPSAQSAYSDVAKSAMRASSHSSSQSSDDGNMPLPSPNTADEIQKEPTTMAPPPRPMPARAASNKRVDYLSSSTESNQSNGIALTDTPATTAPNSPNLKPNLHLSTALSSSVSGASTPSKARATTLDIPGLTRSKVSPDGRIAQRDIGSKLVIVMVGLPARGKSYIVKKLQRYLNWLQHPTEIFNVGERRRVAAGKKQPSPRKRPRVPVEKELRESVRRMSLSTTTPHGVNEQNGMLPGPAIATQILVNGEAVPSSDKSSEVASGAEEEPNSLKRTESVKLPAPDTMDQTANFFDPDNAKALQIREQVALETLDELLDYILFQNGSVGILDATNSTLERRKVITDHISARTEGKLNVLYLESQCLDQGLLERNMHLKLFGPDYKGQDPEASLRDFKKRVEMYQKSYVPLGDYEEQNNMSYIQMIDVGRKLVAHQIRGFLSTQTVSYLMNFNLAPRQIWLTRHGESMDNVKGKLGGDSNLSDKGRHFAKDLTKFMIEQRELWEQHYKEKREDLTFPPRSGNTTPPNPECSKTPSDGRNFCVWTSMLKRSIETAENFDDEEFDLKQMKMLDEINAGIFEGMTYDEIKKHNAKEFDMRRMDKLQYRYPGSGGESYLDVINRLQKVIVEVERMTDHVLIIGHRSVTRILLAYFKNLKREDVAHLDVPLGVAYMLEPKPYGVDFKAYRWNEQTGGFDYEPDFQLRRAPNSYKD